jgi:hypothetical protein
MTGAILNQLIDKIRRFPIKMSAIGIFKSLLIVAVLALPGVAQDGDWTYTTLIFPVGNDNPDQFGFIEPDDTGPGVGPKSMILHSRYAYVTDQVHGHVKRIDLTSGILITSPALSDRPRIAWPGDIAIFDSLLYVTSLVKSIYVLGVDLEHLYTMPLLYDTQPYFIEIGDDSLLVCETICDHPTVVYSPDSIVALKDTSMIFYFNKTPHGKRYILDEDSISLETDVYTLALSSPFPNIFENLDAINIDFNDSTLVYFDINQEKFMLHIYRRRW